MPNQADDLIFLEEEEGFEQDTASDEGWLTSFGDLMSLLLVFFILLMSASKISNIKFEQVKNALNGQVEEGDVNLITLSETLNKTIITSNLKEKVSVDLSEDAVRLVFHESLLFRSGEAKIISKNLPVLHKIIEVVKNVPAGTRLTVEGHTDNIPIRGGRFRNNWELSSARALTVMEEFEVSGFPSSQLSFQGFGSQKPVRPNQDEANNPLIENQRLNRRVVVRMY